MRIEIRDRSKERERTNKKEEGKESTKTNREWVKERANECKRESERQGILLSKSKQMIPFFLNPGYPGIFSFEFS